MRLRPASRRLAGGMAAASLALAVSVAMATEAQANAYAQGPQAAEVAAVGAVPFTEPPVIQSQDGILDATLRVVLVDADGEPIDCDREPSSDDVAYRAYQLPGQDVPLPTGPTLKFAPGDVLRVLVRNEMCAFKQLDDADKQERAELIGSPPQVTIDQNRPHGFNHTNLHTHGLWVSPVGNSDNVLNVIPPETSFQHEYLIPTDHVPGTHWYHPHKHGSVATQVQTGMSGALIMTGGIDDLPLVRQARESVMVIQKFRASRPVLAAAAAITPEADPFRFPQEDVTTINGVRGPTLAGVAPGETLRWRIVAAMSGGVLNLTVTPGTTCSGDEAARIPLHPIAYDGIPVAEVAQWEMIRLFPGNRADLMLRFETPGTYAICTRQRPDDETEDPEVIGYVQVDQPPIEPPRKIPAGFAAEYRHPSLLDDPAVVKDQRHVLFTQLSSPFRVYIDNHRFDVNRVDQKIPLGAKQEWLLLNDTPGFDSFHPFHIHVNPFQIVDSNDPIYRKMKGVWLDTVGIPGSDGTRGGPPGAPGWVKIRSHFKKFIGLYVLHCHILGHEDAGMMQIVEVYPAAPE